MKDNKIVLIMCYFGKLPKYFELFLKTCQYNYKIDFLLFTDQDVSGYNNLANFSCKNMEFADFQKYVQSKFDFKISLSSAYKICDYRPAFGYIFKDYIVNYDFWGHCDMDMMLGNIIDFLPYNLYDYSKLYHSGHFTLYRNNEENNLVFKNSLYGLNFEEVFKNDKNFIFDEFDGIDKKYRNLELKKYYSWDYIDVSTKSYTMKRAKNGDIKDLNDNSINYSNQLFVWEKGRIFRYYYMDKEVKKEEYNYIHFQKRNMKKICNINSDVFAITSDGFISINNKINLNLIKLLNRNHAIKNFNYWLNSYSKRIKNKITSL